MRYIKLTVVSVILAAAFVACSTPDGHRFPSDITPPDVEARQVELTMHGHTRIDPYYWLNERENPEMLAYLEAENEYLKKMMAHTEPFQESLFQEMRARIKEDDASVPYELNGYFYYTRFEEGKEYPIYARRKGSMDAPEEVLVDGNVLAEGKSYFRMTNVSVSPDNRLGAFAVDTVGRRLYTIYVKDLETGDLLSDKIANVTPNFTWSNSQTLFYARQDRQTLRYFQIYRHTLGENPERNTLVYQENDDTFATYVIRTKSEEFITILSMSTLSTEVRIIPTSNPAATPRVFQSRQRGHEYFVDHFGDHFYIRTNHEAENFRLMRTPIGSTSMSNWEEVIAHREDVLLERFDIFNEFLVVSEFSNALPQIRIRNWSTGEEHYLDFGEPAYFAYTTTNVDFNTTSLRYGYTSLTTPMSTYEYDMATRTRTLLKETEVVGDFDRNNYVTERKWATAKDGTQIPISIVYRKGTRLNGNSPLLQYAYGSYGYSTDATFSSARLSLLDRGFIYAIAHIRGGQEMGRTWYEQGKMKNKMNSFTDFIAVSEYLIENKYTNPDRLFAMGGSAGGLLMGAVINLRPELYKGVIAQVPFVDVVTTMLDDTIPLTTSEYDEWGNPNEEEYYYVLLEYSPYDQVEAKDYPHLLVTSGLHDSQVQYWEPTKWVAKLRDMKTDDNVLLLYTNMDAGHGGASGRFQRLREVAMEYVFMLELAGIYK